MSGADNPNDDIVAIVTLHPDTVQGGGAPVFVAKDEERLKRMALLLSKMTRGMIHDLEDGTYVIVRH